MAEPFIPDFNIYSQPEAAPEPPPSWSDTFGAAFRMENDVVNAIDLMTRPVHQPDPSFNTSDWLKKNKLWEDYRDNYVGVRSEAEALEITDRIRSETKDRETLERSGWAGITAGFAAGVASPTMLLPVVGGGRGAVAIGRALALGGFAGAVQEFPLQLAQETRTTEESAFAVAASTIVGGLLGGAVSVLTKEELGALEETISKGMHSSQRDLSIPSPAGAAPSRAASPGKFLPAGGATKLISRISPVIRTVQQDTSALGRWMMSQMSDAGLIYEQNLKGVPTTPLGTAENLAKTWYGNYAKAVEISDENYLAFVYDGNVPAIAPNIRAIARGSAGSGEKSKTAFREAVAKAMREGDQSDNPYVAATAQAYRKEVYDPILKEAQRFGIIPKELEDTLTGDVSYLFRDYDTRVVEGYFEEFVGILSRNFERQLNEKFMEDSKNFKAALERDDEAIQALKMTDEEVEVNKDVLGAQLVELERQANAQHLTALEESIAALRAKARELPDTAADEMVKKQWLKDARDMEQSAGEPLAQFKASRGKIKRQLSLMNKAQAVLKTRALKKLQKIEAAEDNSTKTLQRLVKKGHEILAKLDDLLDKEFDKLVGELKGEFAQVGKQFDKGEEVIKREVLKEGDENVGRLLGMDVLQQRRANNLSEIAERLDDAERLDRGDIRAIIQDGLDEAIDKTRGIVERRGARNARLRAQAGQLTQDELGVRIQAIRDKRAEKLTSLEDRIKTRGAESVDVTSGAADFTRFADEKARQVARKITARKLRLPAFDVMEDKRGAELARMLEIPSREIEKFLVNDVEEVTRRYLRTMAPDIEMSRKFGSINAQEQFDDLDTEMEGVAKRKEQEIRKANGEKKKPLDSNALDAKIAQMRLKNAEEYAAIKRDLAAVVGRIRHTWGLPDDPSAISYRMGRVAMNLNVMRMMGGVVVSSVPDLARPVMKYGLVRTFKDGFLPLITDLKRLKMSNKELRLAGAALDVILHSRSMAMYDILDDMQRGSKFERAIEYGTKKFGIIALFDQWTAGMKQFTGAIANVRIMDALQKTAEGSATVKDKTFLASLGIDEVRAGDMWDEVVKNGGGEKVNGAWMPNTEAWKNEDNIRAYRSAILREVDNAIVTPGAEKPLWTDKTMTGRMLGQFKSFAMSSTSKTLLAGLQQTDANFVVGSAISLALGALSYAIWAATVGGEAYDAMLEAGLDKWADEAIDRSGLTGVLSLAQGVASAIPATAPYATFSGGRTTRRGGGSLIDELGGPSWDLAERLSKTVTDIDDPTQSTIHTIRTLAPGNNIWHLRRAYDAIENSVNLPERRQ